LSKHLMSTREVCEELLISTSTLYSWRTAGVAPPALKIGKHLRFPRAGFEEWLANRTTTVWEARNADRPQVQARRLKAVQ
jgi:excisionase family DNA binding protein